MTCADDGMDAGPLFASDALQARPLRADEVPTLQRLLEADPSYFLAVNGRPPDPDEAQVEFDERPPPHLPWRANHVLGLYARGDDDGAEGPLRGVMIVVEDLVVDGTWHVALLWLTGELHGRGLAAAIYRAAEAWMVAAGARWVRLGVVSGNARAERFWARMGFTTLRWRRAVDTGGRVNDVRVMLRVPGAADVTAAEAGIADYLSRAPRDRPDAGLP